MQSIESLEEPGRSRALIPRNVIEFCCLPKFHVVQVNYVGDTPNRAMQIMRPGEFAGQVIGLALATALAAHAVPSIAQNAGVAKNPATAPTKSIKLRTGCDKPRDSLRPQCRKFAQAEPKVVPFNGFFQFVWLPLVAGSGAVVAVSGKNSKNCGKGNNSQNNGNCPASP